MNCQQKSGIFLNISCTNEAIKECSNCGKKVCKTHHHILEKKKLCEDCYWEFFLYSEHNKVESITQVYSNSDSGSLISGSSSSSSPSNSPTEFKEGFGGGEFGGGGASGIWNEGDKQGFEAENAVSGADLFDSENNDSTFFYS